MLTAFKSRQDATVYLYAAALIALSAAVNYFEPRLPVGIALVLISLLYLPVLLLPRRSGWTLASLGIQFNLRALLMSGLFALILLAFLVLPGFVRWENALAHLLEGYARTGEEFFYRGFLFTLILSVFRRFQPVFLAVLVTSLAFTFTHTQYLLTGAGANLALIYGLSLFLALLRAWTGSILPGILLHLLLNLSPLGALVGTALFALFFVWSSRRGETPFTQLLA